MSASVERQDGDAAAEQEVQGRVRGTSAAQHEMARLGHDGLARYAAVNKLGPHLRAAPMPLVVRVERGD